MDEREDLQLNLFEEYDGISSDAAYLRLSSAPQLFFSRPEVAYITGRNFQAVRWAIGQYCLDALLIGSSYRIPRCSLEDYLADPMSPALPALDEYLEGREVADALSIAKAYQNGRLSRQEAFNSFPFTVGPQLRKNILDMDTARWDRHATTRERHLKDWYRLGRLDLPQAADLQTWAGILRIEPAVLNSSSSWSTGQIIPRDELLEFLIRHEIVNLPVFATRKPAGSKAPVNEDVGQPTLF